MDKRTSLSHLRQRFFGRMVGPPVTLVLRRLLLVGGLVMVVGVACLGTLTGCGGGGGQTAQAPPPPPPGPEMYMEPGAPPGPPASPPAKPAEQKPKVELPEDFAQWEEEHFKQARKEGGEKLLKAVHWLGHEAPDKERAAEILTALIKKLPPEEAPKPKPQPSPYPGAESYPGSSPEMYAETYPGPGYPGYPGAPGGPGQRGPTKADLELIHAICDALGANGTARADQTFRDLLEAKIETDNDRVAQQATLEALVRYLNPAREELIFAVLTTPEKFRPVDPQAVRRTRPGYGASPGYPGDMEYGPSPPAEYGPGYPGAPGMAAGQKPMSAQELQEAAFQLIRPVASEEFRVRLARHVINPKTPQEDFELFLPYLLEDDARNLSAQMELLAHLAEDPNVRKVVETVAIDLSSRAMAEVLGIPRDLVDEMQALSRLRLPGGQRGPGMPGYSEYGPGYGMEAASPPGPMGPTGPMEAPGAGRPSRTAQTRPTRVGAADQPGMGPRGAAQPQVTILRLSDLGSLDSRLLLSLAGKIWSPQGAAFVEKQLGSARSLKENANAVVFASTIPVESVRRSLTRVLRTSWEEGPDALEQAGILESVVFSPGYLLALKELPRKLPDMKAQAGAPGGVRPSLGRLRGPRRPGPGGPGPGPGQPGMPGRMPEGPGFPPGREGPMGPEEMMPGGPGTVQPGMGRPTRVIPGAEQASPKDRAAMAWALHLLDALRATNERLYEASRTLGGGGFSLSPGEEEAAGKESAYRMPPNAKLLGHYEIDLGKAVAEKVPGVSGETFKIKYWRLEDTTAPRTILGFFRRIWGEGEEREYGGIYWVEMRLPAQEGAGARVVDILIDTGVGAEPGGFTLGAEPARGGTTPSLIDILVFEFGGAAGAE